MNTTLITVSDSCLILKYCEIYGNMVPDGVALMRAVNSYVTIEDTILYENYFGPQGLIQFRSSDVHIEDVQIVSRLRHDVNPEAVIGHQPEPHDTSVIQTDQSNITLEEVLYYRSLDDDGKIFLDVNLEMNNFLKVDTSSFAETLIKIHGSELEVKEVEEIFIDDSILHPTGKHSDDDPDIYLGQSLTIVSHANKKNFSFLPRSQDIFKTKHFQGKCIKSSAIEVTWREEMTIQMMRQGEHNQEVYRGSEKGRNGADMGAYLDCDDFDLELQLVCAFRLHSFDRIKAQTQVRTFLYWSQMNKNILSFWWDFDGEDRITKL